jgi:tetratricopeptide (TPR) repeat protein
MKKLFLLLLSSLIDLTTVIACLNGDTQMLKDGTIISNDVEGWIVPYGHRFFEHNYSDKLKRLDSLWKTTKDIDYLSDYGVVLVFQKEYDKAKDIYLKIEKIQPGRYSTASNLGTVYELLGQNEKALHWIQRAVKIDPKSHNSSEWIHVNILKAKIRGQQNITGNFLLGAAFGTDAKPQSLLTNEELLELRDALYYQLNERVSFIKPKDKIVATLLFELANICVVTGAKKEAIIIYDKSKEYGFADPILQLRYDYAKDAKPTTDKPLVKEDKRMISEGSEGSRPLLWVAVVLGTFLVLFAILKSRRKKNVR